VAGRDITEGRATRAIAVDVGVVSTSAIWQNTDVAYDVAVGGMPFIYANQRCTSLYPTDCTIPTR